VLQLYEKDSETQRHCMYINGEERQFSARSLAGYAIQPLPWKVAFSFTKTKRWVEAEFDPTELLEVFHELDKENPGHMPIDIVSDQNMKFSAQFDGKLFPLTNVKTGLWLINRSRRYY
jgi:hypothetical protein